MSLKDVLYGFIFYVAVSQTVCFAVRKNSLDEPSVEVGITVSSLITTEPPRQLELSWWNADELPGDFIGLYDDEPSLASSLPLARHNVTTSQGYYRTNIQAPRTSSTQLDFTQQCLGYWVAYIRHATVMAAVCLRTHPTWMSDIREQIQTLKLRHVFVPGTHDSAAYRLYNGEDRDTFVTKYSITQEEDVLSQLIYGVRYLDLRIGYYKTSSEVWWANHGIVRIHPLRDIFDQIKKFMQNTNEIVIIDLQEFNTGFGDDMGVHLKLVQYLVTELGSYMAVPTSQTWDARLVDVWESGRRLIVTYDDPQVVASSTLLWPSVEHRWGNVQSLEGLQNFLRGTINRSSGRRAWAAMAELTPTTWSFLTNRLGSLREMADLVNRNVTEWYRTQWGASANVVALDFFRGTGIVEDAISWNRRRGTSLM